MVPASTRVLYLNPEEDCTSYSVGTGWMGWTPDRSVGTRRFVKGSRRFRGRVLHFGRLISIPPVMLMHPP